MGVVLAGGRSSRFGSDKALARYRGIALIDHVLKALAIECDAVAVAGRRHAGVEAIEDWPAPGMGPLGAIAGALRRAVEGGHSHVLSAPVDCLRLPHGLVAALSPAPACVATQPVVGLWPVAASATLEAVLRGDGSHSVRAFAAASGARQVEGIGNPHNINTPADLAAVELGDDRSW